MTCEDRQPAPLGFVQPPHDRARRALIALEERRFRDAEEHIAALPETDIVDRAWRLVLRGMLHIGRKQLSAARADLLEAAALAFGCQYDDADVPRPELIRLAALALCRAGWVYRRHDRPRDAYRLHRTSYALRCAHGSAAEQWEAALELALDAQIEKRFDVATQWLDRAAEHAAAAHSTDGAPPASVMTARTWSQRAALLTDAARLEDAVPAARKAAALWHAARAAEPDAPVADARLGHALLRQAEALYEHDPARALDAARESLALLATARDELLAFGEDAAEDAAWCADQVEFARRLTDSFEPLEQRS